MNPLILINLHPLRSFISPSHGPKSSHTLLVSNPSPSALCYSVPSPSPMKFHLTITGTLTPPGPLSPPPKFLSAHHCSLIRFHINFSYRIPQFAALCCLHVSPLNPCRYLHPSLSQHSITHSSPEFTCQLPVPSSPISLTAGYGPSPLYTLSPDTGFRNVDHLSSIDTEQSIEHTCVCKMKNLTVTRHRG